MNAVLQCLRASDAFVGLLDSADPEDNSDAGRLSSALHRFFTGKVAGVDEILSLSGRLLPQFATYDQQDAHEWLRFLFARLEKFPSVALCRLSLRSSVTCEVCAGVFARTEDALDLSLSLPPEISSGNFFSRSQSGGASLDECLAAFQQAEALEEKYACERCKEKTKARKQITVENTPEILCMHLKRFSVASRSSWLPFLGTTTAKNSRLVHFRDSLVLNSATYRLVGLVQHRGSGLSSGHYVAFTRSPQNPDTWFLCDDARVSQVAWDKTVANAEAYMLFYVREKPGNFSIPQEISDPVYMSTAFLRRVRLLAEPGVGAVIPVCEKHGNSQKLAALSAGGLAKVDRGFAANFAASETPTGVAGYRRVAFVENLEICETCRSEISNENRRRSLSRDLVSKTDTRQLPVSDQLWHLVDVQWVNRWRQYTDRPAPGNLLEAISDSPGPVDNGRLAERLSEKSKLTQNADFFAVNKFVWSLFCLLHGSLGPEITVASVNELGNFRSAPVAATEELIARLPEQLRQDYGEELCGFLNIG